MIPISQKDPRWGSLQIGNTNYTMSGWGCFVTCVSMVADIPPSEALSKLKFDGAMLIWESIKNIGLEPLYKGEWDNAKALQYISENGQCIARVDFDGSERTDDTHFVVLIGNKQLIDPIDGKVKPTSSYSKYTGIRACRKMTMTTMYKGLDLTNQESMKVAVDVWDEVINKKLYVKVDEYNKLLEAIPATDLDNAKAVLGGIRGRITELENKLGAAQANEKIMNDQVSGLITKVQMITQERDLAIDHSKIHEAGEQEALKKAADLEIKLAQLQNQYETLRQAQTNGEITLTIADLFKMLWNQKITIKK